MNIDEFRALQKVEEPKTEEPVAQKVDEIVEEPVVEEPVKYEIDGKEVTIDELTKGYLRQSDYTKKTTDVSKMRKELDEAVKLFELVQSDPTLQEKLKEAGGDKAVIDAANLENKRIRDLEGKIASMELDKQLSDLKSKYPDFDETLVIGEAAKRKTTDLEFVYKATRKIEKEGEKVDAKELEKIKEQIRAELISEFKAPDAEIPPTLMDGKVPTKRMEKVNGPTMTTQEAAIARGMGISEAEYIKYRDAK